MYGYSAVLHFHPVRIINQISCKMCFVYNPASLKHFIQRQFCPYILSFASSLARSFREHWMLNAEMHMYLSYNFHAYYLYLQYIILYYIILYYMYLSYNFYAYYFLVQYYLLAKNILNQFNFFIWFYNHYERHLVVKISSIHYWMLHMTWICLPVRI